MNREDVLKLLAFFLDYKIRRWKGNIITFTTRSIIKYLTTKMKLKNRSEYASLKAYLHYILQEFVTKGYMNLNIQAKKTKLYILDTRNEKHRKLIECVKNSKTIDEIFEYLKKIYFE